MEELLHLCGLGVLQLFYVNPLRQPSVSQKVSVCYREREFDAI